MEVFVFQWKATLALPLAFARFRFALKFYFCHGTFQRRSGLALAVFESWALPRSALPSCEFASRTLPVCFAPNFALCYSTKNSTYFCYRVWKNSVEILVGIRKISRTDFKNNSYGFSNLSCTDSMIFLILYESSGGTNHIHSSNYQMHIYRHHLQSVLYDALFLL